MSVFLGIVILGLLAAGAYLLLSGNRPAASGSSRADSASQVSDPSKRKSGGAAREGQVQRVFKKLDQAREASLASNLQSRTLYQTTFMDEGEFFGRKTVLHNLITKNREGAERLGLFGARGQGKTATAQQVIGNLKPFYPRAQIYFNFDWADPPPQALHQALAHVVTSFQPEKKLPVTLEELTRRYRKVLKEGKVALLFDNVPNVETLQGLAAPPRNLVIVTAGQKLPVDQMIWEEIDALPLEDARDLLTKLCGRIGFWMAEFGKYCGSNTLALTLGARFLAEFSSLDPELFTTKLRDQYKNLEKSENDRNRVGIESVLNLVYQVMPDPLKRLTLRLTLFPATFDAEAEAFICEDRENIKLETLVRIGLVSVNEETGRYHIPSALRSWLHQRLDGGTRALTETRLCTYYMTLLQGIHEGFQSTSPAQRGQALNLFDTEWSNLRFGQAWAQANCLKDQDTARLCQGYTDFGYPLLKQRQPPEVRLPWLEGGLLAAQTLQEEEAERECLLLLGNELVTLQRFGAAVEVFEKALGLADEAKDPRFCLEVMHGLGLAYQGDKIWDKAQDQFMKERQLAGQLGQAPLQLRAEEALVAVFQLSRDPAQGMEWIEKALATARQVGDPEAEARLVTTLGEVQLQSGKLEEAVQTLQQALKKVSGSADKITEGRIHRFLGEAFREMKEPAKAAASFEQAANLFAAGRDTLAQAEVLGQQGLALIQAGDPEAGARWVEKAVKLFRKIKRPKEEARLLEALGQLHLEGRRWEPAIRTLRALGERAARAGLKPEEARALHFLGQALEGKGEREEALTHYKSALQRFEQVLPAEAPSIKEHILKLEKEVLSS